MKSLLNKLLLLITLFLVHCAHAQDDDLTAAEKADRDHPWERAELYYHKRNEFEQVSIKPIENKSC